MTAADGAIASWDWAQWLWRRNHYYRVGGIYTFTNPTTGTAVSGLANWQAIAGETESATGDPLFVDAANHDYHLQQGSPANGRGCYPTGADVLVGMRANPTYPYVAP